MGDDGRDLAAENERHRYRPRRLGELLVSAGAVSEDVLARALEAQLQRGGRLGQVLVEERAISEGTLAQTIAEQQSLPLVDLAMFEVDLGATTLIDRRFAERHGVLPVGFAEDELVVAMSDPLDIQTMDSLRTMTGRRIRAVVTTESSLREAIDRYVDADESFESVLRSATAEVEEETGSDKVEALIEDVPVVKLVNRILTEAVRQQASDVHIEPQEKNLRVRYRVDGVLHDIMTVPKSLQAALISRVKIMAEMNIAERRLPQDGRAALDLDGKALDVRVAALPTANGENLTLRLLSREFSFLSLEEIGFEERLLEQVVVALGRPYGALLVCGPTGAGKTTTLYAALKLLNREERKIITIEDPVEYRIPGVAQIQVNSRIGLTFAAGLRSVLRSDPDVVMVGEMRDPDTSQIAVRGAMTGHLVLSSLHTNDAPSALTRLVDVGVPPFLISGAVLGVLAQRLLRRLCDSCKKEYRGSPEIIQEAGIACQGRKKPTFFKAVGCEKCYGTGYKGRFGVFEFVEMTQELGKMAIRSSTTEDIREAALAAGMQSIRKDAVCKMLAGMTSLEELTRVLG